jgi:hypothetical protein
MSFCLNHQWYDWEILILVYIAEITKKGLIVIFAIKKGIKDKRGVNVF